MCFKNNTRICYIICNGRLNNSIVGSSLCFPDVQWGKGGNSDSLGAGFKGCRSSAFLCVHFALADFGLSPKRVSSFMRHVCRANDDTSPFLVHSLCGSSIGCACLNRPGRVIHHTIRAARCVDAPQAAAPSGWSCWPGGCGPRRRRCRPPPSGWRRRNGRRRTQRATWRRGRRSCGGPRPPLPSLSPGRSGRPVPAPHGPEGHGPLGRRRRNCDNCSQGGP